MATVSSIATSASKARVAAPIPCRHKTVARVGIVAGALLAAAILVPSSLADWVSVDHPLIASRIAPWNAPAAANAAAALRAPRSPLVRALVSQVLARDVTQVQAIELRALDLAVSGKTAEARRLFELSDRLSRRSLPTRLWLIQDAVDRGDVTGALRNFDIALRTTTDAQPILFPVLAKASADPTLTLPLARTLDRPSDWRLMFLNWAMVNGSHVDGVAKVVAQMRDCDFVVGNGIDQRLIERLVHDRDFAAASLIFRRFGQPSNSIMDGNFADRSARYPFGWGLVSDGSLIAERGQVGSSPALNYRATVGSSGQVAAQLLVLRSGAYLLRTQTATRATGEAPYWSVTCGEAGGAQVARLDQPKLAGSQATTTLIVPDGCAAQWLTLRIRPSAEATAQSGAIAWVALSPLK